LAHLRVVDGNQDRSDLLPCCDVADIDHDGVPVPGEQDTPPSESLGRVEEAVLRASSALAEQGAVGELEVEHGRTVGECRGIRCVARMDHVGETSSGRNRDRDVEYVDPEGR
jgi:hypothetical protein